ncbi:MAG: alpha/beta hydrolase [Candidatus Sumerlaeota bacterium]
MMVRACFLFLLAATFFLSACGPPSPPAVMNYIEDRGLLRIDETHSVSYIRGGDHDGQRVIYIHGTPGSAQAFEHYIAEPIPGTESISIDRFGFGKSLPHGSVPSLQEQASAVEPFLTQQNGKWPILVGHSLGGPIAARAAADYPERVGGLVILAGAFDPALEHVTGLQKFGNFAFVPRILPSDIRNMNRELIPLKGELQSLQPLLKNIRCPIVIIHGKEDQLVPFSNVEYLHEHLPAGSISAEFIFEHENHFIPWTEEPAVRAGIEHLLQK